MRRRIPILLAAMTAVCTLWVFSAQAASSPSLAWEEGDGQGEILLALQDLDGSGVYAAQLELTLSGDWPDADFSPANRELYSVCQTEEYGHDTHMTVYISSRGNPLGSAERFFLGTLDLGGRGEGDDVLPATAKLTLLGRGLNRIEDLSGTVSVRERSGLSGWGGRNDDDEDDAETYKITVLRAEGGAVKANASRAEEGDTVTLTVEADDGWALESLTVSDARGRDVSASERSGGKYTFRMPRSSVEVKAVFVQTAQIPDEPEPPTVLPFADVRESDWYYRSVQYVYGQSLMNGTSPDRFGPNDPTTRGMIVTILHRMEGSPEAPDPTFTDVPAHFYYAQPITWAEARGIVTGYGNRLFGPEDNITREQLAAILYRFARYRGWDISVSAPLDRFTDAEKVSSYALEPISWAVGSGLISGMEDGRLSPGGTATRAEVATILMRLEAIIERNS